MEFQVEKYPPWNEVIGLVAHHDGRLRQCTLDWIRSRPTLDEDVVMITARSSEDGLCGVAAVAPTRGIGFVLVAPPHRCRGIGAELVRRCVALKPDAVLEVCVQNVPSVRMCFSAGLQAVNCLLRDNKLILHFRRKNVHDR